MSGDQQFNRAYELLIGSVKITDLQIDFRASRSLDEVPNTLELSIYNLSPSNRGALAEAKNPTVQLSAGYENRIGVVYLGEVRNAVSSYEKPNWVTSMSSGDGEKDMAESRINKSFMPGVSYETVVLEVANSMGQIGIGNLKKILKKGKLPNSNTTFTKGVTVSGSSKKEMRRLMLSSGLEWSIQNRQFQVLEANKSLGTVAYVLSSDSGLIGSPQVDNFGNLRASCLMNADIVPGRQIEVASRYVTGRFRATRCEYIGNFERGGWITDIEAERVEIE